MSNKSELKVPATQIIYAPKWYSREGYKICVGLPVLAGKSKFEKKIMFNRARNCIANLRIAGCDIGMKDKSQIKGRLKRLQKRLKKLNKKKDIANTKIEIRMLNWVLRKNKKVLPNNLEIHTIRQ